MAMINLFTGFGQKTVIQGVLLEEHSLAVIVGAQVQVEGTDSMAQSNTQGHFKLEADLNGTQILLVSSKEFITLRIPLNSGEVLIDLGSVFMARDGVRAQADQMIALSEIQLLQEDDIVTNPEILRATRDAFLTRAAFDFRQGFFRIRGYDSRQSEVLFNGSPMNRLINGRPDWNHWGGLNDVTRNQDLSYGIGPSAYGFGGLLGITNTDTRISNLRPGARLSSSFSNRTYTGRVMFSYSSSKSAGPLKFAFSSSRRWGDEGFVNGTLYDAYSFFGGLELAVNKQNTVLLNAFLSNNRRGRSAPLTAEVFELLGNRYNPYWGDQAGTARNSRVRTVEEPFFSFHHFYRGKWLSFTNGIVFQKGTRSSSRLAYFNAPNPDPAYYRYLPSYYINSSFGANFFSSLQATEAFLLNPQIDWAMLYQANKNENSAGRAFYLLQDDVVQTETLSISSLINIKISNKLSADMNGVYKQSNSANFARIADLLGAKFHTDVDPFSDTRNDINGDLERLQDDVFGYSYDFNSVQKKAFAQLKWDSRKWEAFLAGGYERRDFQRTGHFQNERYPEASLGRSEGLSFTGLGFKAGLSHDFNGRHRFGMNFLRRWEPPTLGQVFLDPRERNALVSGADNEKQTAMELNYLFRTPLLTGRISGFYTRFQEGTERNFFYVDTGLGSDFVQEVSNGLDRLHMGVEFGANYNFSNSVKLTFVAAIGKYRYASNPGLTLNFDNSSPEESLLPGADQVDLGEARLKGLNLPAGPQQAYSVGFEYRDPKFWWVGISANYLGHNYTAISKINRTESFFLNPDTGEPFQNIREETLAALLQQTRLEDAYFLNLVGGKSWRIKQKYISLFLSLNNLFDTVFRTGGFEQSRNGNYGQLLQDNLSGTPLFGNKYWYSFGRTYFLNLALNF
ncbi:TonB-dependent receptor [Flavobacteriaceae bacterium R33]|uniref:TonB-dependent receptor n=2 Tax=Poritiphilus flavus TaxID=2697053 RepID=A0A6L9ECV3_9FLAO|nr:TonB-dependent receptor [Poritiphilus flavus]